MIEVQLTPASAGTLMTPRAADAPGSVWWDDMRRTLKAHWQQRADVHWLITDDVLAHEIVENSRAPGIDVAAPDLQPVLLELAAALRPQLTPPWCFEPGPAPTTTALEPATVAIGQPSFDLVVRGLDFKPGAVIMFNGHDEPTTVISDTEVRTGVNMAVWTAPSEPLPVAVRNPDQQASNVLTFTFTAAGAATTAKATTAKPAPTKK